MTLRRRGDLDHAHQPLDLAAAEEYLAQLCFVAGRPGRVGVELEHIVHDRLNAANPVTGSRLDKLIGALTLHAGGVASREPGGQLELSTAACDSLADVISAADGDLATLYSAADADGLILLGEGTDPVRPPRRTLSRPRYDAMEAYFDAWLPHGRQMMCSTAAVQVTVDVGATAKDVASSWHFLHAIGPTLVAMFANSPFLDGRDTGWQSNRQAIWWGLDPSRTRSVHASIPARSPQDEYVEFALDAPVMMIRSDEERWPRPRGLTLRRWLDTSTAPANLPRPTRRDVDYHLTTLFPPVRARGSVEVRYLDAQAGRRWVVPTAVVHALHYDHDARDAALAAVAPVTDCWLTAAREGLSNDALARSAGVILETARASLARKPENRTLVGLIDSYAERYVERRRSPADDRRAQGPYPTQSWETALRVATHPSEVMQ